MNLNEVKLVAYEAARYGIFTESEMNDVTFRVNSMFENRSATVANQSLSVNMTPASKNIPIVSKTVKYIKDQKARKARIEELTHEKYEVSSQMDEFKDKHWGDGSGINNYRERFNKRKYDIENNTPVWKSFSKLVEKHRAIENELNSLKKRKVAESVELVLSLYEAEMLGDITTYQRDCLLESVDEVCEGASALMTAAKDAAKKVTDAAKNVKGSIGKKKREEAARQEAIKKCEEKLQELRREQASNDKTVKAWDTLYKKKEISIEDIERAHQVRDRLAGDIEKALSKLSSLKSGGALAVESVINDLAAAIYQAEAMAAITSDESDYLMESVDEIENAFSDDNLTKNNVAYEKLINRYEPLTAKERSELKKRFPSAECSFAKDKKGYYCYTHRTRSKSYPTIDSIPKKDVDFVSSTS